MNRMEGIKGGRKVGVGQAEDMLDAINYCINHPYKNNNNGGICAFCLQEKLGKLVSSSSPLPLRASSSSSPPDAGGGGDTSLSMSAHPTTKYDNVDINDNDSHYQQYHTRRARIPLAKKKIMASSSSDQHHDGIVFKRSKSTVVTPRSGGRFWSFLHLSNSKTQNAKRPDKIDSITGSIVNDDDDDNVRKVSRSRSVGCGSRSFSGDFFERISTGFGDCTLRRVESQGEGKPKLTAPSSSSSQRVKCGGIFGGFMIMTSSSSSYWVSSTTDQDHINGGKNKSWGWAFASPIRAFSTSKPSSSGNKEDKNINTASTIPNLSAIPSLLAVRS